MVNIACLFMCSLSITANIFSAPKTLFVSAEMTQQLFHLQVSPRRGPVRLGSGWHSPSIISCAASCTSRYPQNCTSFLFNSSTRLCTPGSTFRDDAPLPSSDEGNLYSSAHCDESNGFQVMTTNTARACIAVFAQRRNYSEAAAACQSLGAVLMSVKTIDKLDMLLALVNASAWVGLRRPFQSRIYIWDEDKEQLSQGTLNDVFLLGRGSPSQSWPGDCVYLYTGLRMLRDGSCRDSYHYACEIPFA